MKSVFGLILILLTSFLFSLTNIDGFIFDEAAKLNYTGQNFIYQGYEISILNNPNAPYLYFKKPGSNYTYANYNWAFQYWMSKLNNFNSDEINLKNLYSQINMNKSDLDRSRPSASIVNKLKAIGAPPLTVISQATGRTSQNQEIPEGYNPDHKYDINAEINYNLKELSGYKIIVERTGNPFVMFYDKEKTWWNIAVYNYERQYWVWTMKHFDHTKIDIEKIFTKIDLSKTVLNRLKPDRLSIWGYIDREKFLYDYSNDNDFSNFIDYLKSNNIPQEEIDKFLHSASNPGKRGAALPLGHYYEESETGFQVLHVMPNVDTIEEARKITNDQRAAVGGMQLYFELHNSQKITSISGASKYFRDMIRDDNRVKMTIVEISPPDGTYTDKIRGYDFYREVEKFHEDKFRTNFDIEVETVTIDYNLFKVKPGEEEQLVMDGIFDKYIHDKFGYDKFYMYYFTDSKKFAEVDYKLTHPRIYGAYIANWELKKDIYLHELGHALNLYHHFNLTENASLPEAHIYTPCRMNYRSSFVSEDFCPLCSYSLGISPVIGSYGLEQNTESSEIINQDSITERSIKNIDGATTLYSKYESGTVVENGTYNFGKLQVHEMQWNKDLIVLNYGYLDGNSYIGIFSTQMKFLSEYNMGKLKINQFRAFDNKVFSAYSNSYGNQYIGVFDNNMEFVSEVMVDKTELDYFEIEDNSVIYRYINSNEKHILQFSKLIK